MASPSWRDICDRMGGGPGNAWELELDHQLRIRVYRIQSLGTMWFCDCPTLDIRTTALGGDTSQHARYEALLLVARRLVQLGESHRQLACFMANQLMGDG